MANKRIYLCLAHMSEAGLEQKYIKEAFDTNWVVPLGPNVNGFEEDLRQFVTDNEKIKECKDGSLLKKKVVALSAGTAAVHLALIACGVGPGDEVIVQSFTFCASSHPITYLGATPVFVDSERDTWNMDPGLLEEAIKDRIAKTGKKPKAIVPVALYGMPYQIDRIMEIADRYEIPVVEDAAEGFGSKYKGQMLGTFGKYGVLSFNGNKMITTSGGGALITPDEESWREITTNKYRLVISEGYRVPLISIVPITPMHRMKRMIQKREDSTISKSLLKKWAFKVICVSVETSPIWKEIRINAVIMPIKYLFLLIMHA